MQELLLANDLFADWSGKRVTIRKGHREIKPGQELQFISTDPVPFEMDAPEVRDFLSRFPPDNACFLNRDGGYYMAVTVMVESVTYTTTRFADMRDIISDGFTDRLNMLLCMQRFYPDLEMDDEITIVRFEVVGLE